MVLVSVIMGSYNHERYIAEAIESVLNQTFGDLELIIVDDYSTDHSREIIENYQLRDKRVRASFHQKNLGIAKTTNEGLKQARGEFISFIGSDDVWYLHKLDEQVALAKTHEGKILWSEGEIIDSNGAPNGKMFTEMHLATHKKKTGNIFQEILDENFIFGQSLLVKRDYVNGLEFDSTLKYLNDYRFMADLASKHEFFFTFEPLAKYRIHGENTISKDQSAWFKDRVVLFTYFLQKYGDNIPRNLKGTLYLKIGGAYTDLGRKDLAKYFYVKAILNDSFSKHSILDFICAFTNTRGKLGKFLLGLYFRLNSLLLQREMRS